MSDQTAPLDEAAIRDAAAANPDGLFALRGSDVLAIFEQIESLEANTLDAIEQLDHALAQERSRREAAERERDKLQGQKDYLFKLAVERLRAIRQAEARAERAEREVARLKALLAEWGLPCDCHPDFAPAQPAAEGDS